MTKSFHNKTAVVTGASSGIGAAVASVLAKNGARVFAVARRGERLQALAEQNAAIIPVVQDVTQDLQPLQAVLQNAKIDILVNNAGAALGRDAIQDCPREKWQGMIDKNLTSLIAVTQLILPQMLAQKSGDILNVSSIAGLQTYPNGSVYCAVKHAVTALTEAWQQDLLGKGLRVMAIHPGLTQTEFSVVRFAGDTQKADAVYEGYTPLTASDVADSMLWMLAQPRHVNLAAVTILPTHQASATLVYRK